MKLQAGWVPVALSASIEPGTSAGAVVEGSEIVVWRDNSGNAHVWEDRCPHRAHAHELRLCSRRPYRLPLSRLAVRYRGAMPLHSGASDAGGAADDQGADLFNYGKIRDHLGDDRFRKHRCRISTP